MSFTGYDPRNRERASTTTWQWVFELLIGGSGPLWSKYFVLIYVVSLFPHCSSGASCLFGLFVWHSMQSFMRYTIHYYRPGQKIIVY